MYLYKPRFSDSSSVQIYKTLMACKDDIFVKWIEQRTFGSNPDSSKFTVGCQQIQHLFLAFELSCSKLIYIAKSLPEGNIIVKITQHSFEWGPHCGPNILKHGRHQLLAQPISKQDFMKHKWWPSGCLGQKDDHLCRHGNLWSIYLQVFLFGSAQLNTVMMDNLK